MKGFIKITQTNSQITYINVKHIVKIFRVTDESRIHLIESDIIQTKISLDEIEKLIDNALTL